MDPFSHEKRRSMTPQRVAKLFLLRNGRCGCCGLPLGFKRYEIDHIIPLSAGGTDLEENLQLLCLPCHSTKTGTDITKAARIKRTATRHLVPSKFRRSRSWRR